MNRTLAEKTRSLLHGAKLPYKLWAEAWNTARYLYTKSLVKAHDSTPEAKFKSFNGRKSIVKHLKVYGCTAFEHIPDELRTKLQPKSKKLILVGYATKEKAYRLWNPENDKISISRHVIFDELQVGLELTNTTSEALIDEEPEYTIEEI